MRKEECYTEVQESQRNDCPKRCHPARSNPEMPSELCGRVHAGEKASLLGASASVDGVRETGLLEREKDYS